MKELPKPEVYEQEFLYMPWGKLLKEILGYIQKEVPENGRLLDLMCGPGYFLNEIHKVRPDIKLEGVDIDSRYIEYAKKQYSDINFVEADVRKWQSNEKFDAVLCTGGLHHLPYENQEALINQFAGLVKDGGFVIVADPYIRPYKTESERKIAATELGCEYIKAVIKNGATDDIISATIDILHNDVLPNGEYKTYIGRIQPMVEAKFTDAKLHKTWPDDDEPEFGDYYWILKSKI